MKRLIILLILITVVAISGCISQTLTIPSTITTTSATPSTTQKTTTINPQTQLKECIYYYQDLKTWYGGGKLCNSNGDCVGYMGTTLQSECANTYFEKINKDGTYLNCKIDEDCYVKIGLPPDFPNESKQTIRCNEGYCEMTKNFLNYYQASFVTKKVEYG